jgi:hypothetical protein
MNRVNQKETMLVAAASWTAAALCRFARESKAPEDWRRPKPSGNAFIQLKI